MLAYLQIRGLAVIDQLALELTQGLNVLTGETGAGKSIIVGALGSLRGSRGARSRPLSLRAGAEQGVVEAQFIVPPGSTAEEALARLGVAPSAAGDGGAELVLSRVLSRGGRSRAAVQGALVPQAQLAAVGECLVDICSQHEQHSLARLGRHLELLDEHLTDRGVGSVAKSRGGLSFGALLAEYRQRYAELRRVERELAEARAVLGKDPALGAYWQHQLEELTAVDPREGEWEELSAALRRLHSAQIVTERLQQVEHELSLGEDAVTSKLHALERQLRAVGEAELSAVAEPLESARLACEAALSQVERLLAREASGESLAALEERRHQLATLRRKHGEDLIAARERLSQEVGRWQGAEERVAALDVEREAALEQALGVARELHQRRVEGAAELGRAVTRELASLHMPHAQIRIQVEELTPERLHAAGLDRVELLVSANPGEPPGPLSEVASGGELSRVLLALSAVSRGRSGVSTYVFDEVDAGVGGKVADAIGRRLLGAARGGEGSQVLCITHLPQVAAYADSHFRVEKVTRGGRAQTRVVRLSEAERREELARMLGGAEVTDSALAHAERLLVEARKVREAPAGGVRRAARARGARRRTSKRAA
ncbi:MAG: DNA repair protein RecN [Polyangiaceae bacterium]|nr:DNA repair protein RecN [Polyangiaceae bacterium]MCW5789884.1 DNA repair protein RecN [Polyangiaceae bacterium]